MNTTKTPEQIAEQVIEDNYGDSEAPEGVTTEDLLADVIQQGFLDYDGIRAMLRAAVEADRAQRETPVDPDWQDDADMYRDAAAVDISWRAWDDTGREIGYSGAGINGAQAAAMFEAIGRTENLMYEDIEDVASDIDHVCYIDCDLIIREGGGRSHIMYPASPTTAAGRYQYDRNREIYTMGKGARAAMRATGQSDTRNNREWNYARKLFLTAGDRIANGMNPARSDADYRYTANLIFGPDRRPYIRRRIRETYRREKTSILGAARALGAFSSQAGLASISRSREQLEPMRALLFDGPRYLPGSEHDPNL